MPLWRLFESSKARQKRLFMEQLGREINRRAEARRQREEFLIDQEARALMQSTNSGDYYRARAYVIRNRSKHRARNKLLANVTVFVLVGLFLLTNNLINQTWAAILLMVWSIGLVFQFFNFQSEHGRGSEVAPLGVEWRDDQEHVYGGKQKRRISNLSIADLSEDGEFSDEIVQNANDIRRLR